MALGPLNTMEFAIFFFFAAVAVIFAMVVVLHRNPVVGALSLVASFFALAVMYVLLDAPFLAALRSSSTPARSWSCSSS